MSIKASFYKIAAYQSVTTWISVNVIVREERRSKQKKVKCKC